MREFLFKRFIPFLVALLLGMSTSAFFTSIKETKSETSETKVIHQKPFRQIETGGTGICRGHQMPSKENYYDFLQPKREEKEKCKDEYKPLQISRQPRPAYTEEARNANISGKVRLRVTFAASGQISNVVPITELPFGLTEQAIIAARKMKFEPEIRCGVPITRTKIVEYGFNIY